MELKHYKDIKKLIQKLKINVTSFLNIDINKLIYLFMHPNKIELFNLLFSINEDDDSSSTFNYYFDGVFPTVTVF